MPPPETPRSRGDLIRVGSLVVAFTLIGAAAHTLVDLFVAPPDGLVGLTVRSTVVLLLLLPLVWALCRTAGHTLSSIGLGTPARAWPPLVTAALSTGAGSVLVVTAALLTGAADLDTTALLPAVASALLLTTLMVFSQILPEELVFRGYVQQLLGYRLSQATVVLVQTALFAGSVSLILGTTDALLNLALLGVLLGLLRTTTGGIWAGVGVRLALTATVIVLNGAGLAFPADTQAWNLALVMVGSLVGYLVVRFLFAARPGLTRAPTAQDSLPRRRIPVRGILYDVGSSYAPGQHSRERWNPDAVREEMRVVHEDLHCTTVSLFGHDPDRLEQAARFALEQGLDVWLQPRSVDADPDELVEQMERVAARAGRLLDEYPDRVVLNVGCELTIFNRGILPGRDMGRRIRSLSVFGMIPAYYDRRLNAVLRRLVTVARERFPGPLSYGSGTWETVDWSPFDLIGVDYYFDELTRGTYRQGLRALKRWGRPVVVTEFGCCSYQGAETKGGSGADPLDWRDLSDRKVRGNLIRDERVQADMIDTLIDVYETEDVHGAFLCMFIEGDCRYSLDPTRDNDMASFGVVRPPTWDSGLSPDDGHWEPKEGFHALARRYGADVPAPPDRV
ncbi:type II CAAX prenyl endopeptidase Rce1 family protein [Nocardiopsis sp. MG754419]|uniref:CPBP family glutamic-type intramembrane protease n=1 Tax=Nocardiopsis sp. MG754419 TaxID=2259865 RepID=UPI001BA5291E|nr:CPBP family glutamic-type intramembrane protease [Nocardiopsis sp. MG754419]MBR8742295.1 CPBP family intramembrane metalloprotease [Nocardiopsis sp. MG754419]